MVLVVWALALSGAEGATRYVRAEATGAGTGADWNNAYTSIPATLSRGDTFYVADGDYTESAWQFDDALSGTTVTTIKKATVADHGTGTGWLDSYGDGQAVLLQVRFTTGYWTFDGNSKGSYGFSVRPTSQARGVWVEGTSRNVIVRNVSVDCNGADATTRCLQVSSGAQQVLVQNCELFASENDTISMGNVTECTFDDVYMHSRRTGAGIHGDAMEIWGGTSNTVKNCRFAWNGQQIFFGGGKTHGVWHIYNNRFYGGPSAGKGIHPHSTNPTVGPIYVYNNTFNDLNIGMDLDSNTTGDVKNNIFLNIGSNVQFGSTSHDYNYFETGLSTGGEANAQSGGDPFVDEPANNYRLASPTAPGAVLPEPYNADPDDVRRGSDGVWDRGAFESAPAGARPPSAPTGLEVRL